MKIYYDTEFLEDGRTIELISIGMVDAEGREFYAVSDEVAVGTSLHGRICKHKWLMENVVPHLPLAPRTVGERTHGWKDDLGGGFFRLDMESNVVMPRRMIRNGVRDFIVRCDPVELWADYGAYDHVVLAQLWGRMIELPPFVPMYTNDIQQELRALDPAGLRHHNWANELLPTRDTTPHNALDDAREVRRVDEWLMRCRYAVEEASSRE